MNDPQVATAGDAIDLLTRQHREVDRLWTAMQSATAPDDDGVTRIVALLSQHDALETTLLYPELRERGGDAGRRLSDHSLDEHQQVRELLAQVDRGALDGAERFAVLGKAVEAVQHHVEEEESQVFPLLRSCCDEARLQELGEKMAAMLPSAPTHPHPAMPDSKLGATVAGKVAGVVDKARDAVSGKR